MNTMKASRVLTLAMGGCLFAAQAQAALVAAGDVVFGPPDTGNAFSGTVYAEIFDSSGGTFSRTGDMVSATTGDYTAVFQVVMDPDAGGDPASLADLSFAAYQLGPGAYGNGGGDTGGAWGGDPVFSASSSFLGYDAVFSFGGGGLAEGATSNAFYFLHTSLDMTGDSIFVGGSGVYAGGTNSFNVSLTLAPVSAVPVPAAAWLFGSGLLGLLGAARRKNGV